MQLLTLYPSLPEHSTVRIPGSKSYTNRALIIASLASGESQLAGASLSNDSEVLMHALRCLGVDITVRDGNTICVQGGVEKLRPYSGVIDLGPAGTAMRFLTALCAAIPGADVVLQGSARMHERPIRDLVVTLKQAGANIDYLGTEGYPPLRVHSQERLKGDALSIDGSTSSQFISSLALIAPLFKNGLSLYLDGEVTSRTYLGMTFQSIRDFGVSIEHDGYKRITVQAGQSYLPQRYQIEGDASGASYLWGIAALTKRSVTVGNINPASAQGDLYFPRLLEQMGCTVDIASDAITVTGPRELRAVEATMELMPDTAQTLAVVAACAKGTSVIRGLKTLRVKETDRIDAMHRELLKVGVRSEVGPDYLVVHGGTPHAAQIATYEDHRMAMSFAMLGALISGIVIEEPQVVAKSFPNFWQVIRQLGIQSTYQGGR
jgi:3-phosphoshikimate 1-carboxyvinyltransferase